MPTKRARTPKDFTPVPVAPRHDGWTVARQVGFIDALRETGCVSEAAAAVGMSARSAYRLRHRPEAAAFDRAWGKALKRAGDRLLEVAIERAIHGPLRHVRLGDRIIQERVPDTRLMIYLLNRLGTTSYHRSADHQYDLHLRAETLAELTDSDIVPADDPVCAPGPLPGDADPAAPAAPEGVTPVSGATFATFAGDDAPPPPPDDRATPPTPGLRDRAAPHGPADGGGITPLSGATFATFSGRAADHSPPPDATSPARPETRAGRPVAGAAAAGPPTGHAPPSAGSTPAMPGAATGHAPSHVAVGDAYPATVADPDAPAAGPIRAAPVGRHASATPLARSAAPSVLPDAAPAARIRRTSPRKARAAP